MITRLLNKISLGHSLPSFGRGMGVGLLAFFGLFATTSCEDMLEVENDSMVIDPSLDAKTDSVFYALGIAQAMQQVADQYFFVGEMRGELSTTTTHTDEDLRQLANYSATASNEYNNGYLYYQVINNCNYYLANRKTDLYIGATNVAIDEYAAVAAWRAWAYLQLARTYGGEAVAIPFYTEPLTAISQIEEDNFPKKTLKEIVAALAPELEQYSGLKVPTFGNAAFNAGNTNWGGTKTINFQRIFVPVDVILGEMYLEAGQYQKAAQFYCKYLCDNSLRAERIFGGLRTLPTGTVIIGAGSDFYPSDFYYKYNGISGDNYFQIYAQNAPTDVLTYIPMASTSQRGLTTNVPLAFGYDYYSTEGSGGSCPRVDEIQIAASPAFHALTNQSDYYYYPINTKDDGSILSYPDTVHIWKAGDSRAQRLQSGRSDSYIFNVDMADTSKVYITKMRNANIYLFRTTTVYLHLAEALNRMGYYDLAFAILRNGISTYLEDLVPVTTTEGGITVLPQKYQYLSKKDINLLTNEVPFLNPTNRNKFDAELFEIYGIHHHGGGTENSSIGGEATGSVSGSRATAVGSELNHHYLPDTIIGLKLKELGYAEGIEVSKDDSINAMEEILCDEYAKEFAFEGIRFYDLQRIARHKEESGFNGNQWFAKKLQGNNPSVDLTDPKNWYLPFK